MPPVEASATAAGRPHRESRGALRLGGVVEPRPPVAALAHPEFASTARRAFSSQRSRVTSTGAAGVPVAVKRAALTGSRRRRRAPQVGFTAGLDPAGHPCCAEAGRQPGVGREIPHVRGRGHQRE